MPQAGARRDRPDGPALKSLASGLAGVSQNKIRLTREFFNEVEDGEILLTFHFWSGEKVTYLLDKSPKYEGLIRPKRA